MYVRVFVFELIKRFQTSMLFGNKSINIIQVAFIKEREKNAQPTFQANNILHKSIR